MCIRCRKAAAPVPLGYCALCSLNVRLELAGGLDRLAAYLSAWAAFADWQDEQGLESP
ncbi:MAG TPA: hypothetical protein VES61_01810 [Gaiellaceae bacterium]|nr:hypothetical protein [Gaiellaceae bacterium]